MACLPADLAALVWLQALDEVLPSVAAEKVAAGGFWVLRPDSGDPTDAVLAALRAADHTFGSDINAKGFKVCGLLIPQDGHVGAAQAPGLQGI